MFDRFMEMAQPEQPAASQAQMITFDDGDDSVILLRFYNFTSYKLAITWHRRVDNRQFSYGHLEPRKCATVRSFQGHVWSFVNELGESMITNFNFQDDGSDPIYYTVPELPKGAQDVVKFNVYVHIRMKSLLYLSAKAIAKHKLDYEFLPPVLRDGIDYFAEAYKSAANASQSESRTHVTGPPPILQG